MPPQARAAPRHQALCCSPHCAGRSRLSLTHQADSCALRHPRVNRELPQPHGWGEALAEDDGAAWRGLHGPPGPPWHPPGQEHGARAPAVQGWRQHWPCWGRSRGDLAGHRPFSKAFIGVSLAAAGHWGTEQRADTKLRGDRTRTGMAASAAGGAGEPQGWLQGCGAAAGSHQTLAQSCVAVGGWMRPGLSSGDLLATQSAPTASFLEGKEKCGGAGEMAEPSARAGDPPQPPQAPTTSDGAVSRDPSPHPGVSLPDQPSPQETPIQTPLSPA